MFFSAAPTRAPTVWHWVFSLNHCTPAQDEGPGLKSWAEEPSADRPADERQSHGKILLSAGQPARSALQPRISILGISHGFQPVAPTPPQAATLPKREDEEVKEKYMIEFNVIPLEKAGPVSLGMNRQQVRDALSVPVVSFKKTSTSAAATDAFLEHAFQVFYDENDRAEFIELSSGGPFTALYKGISVFETKADDLVALVSQDASVDLNDPELGYSFVFPALELSLWRGSLPETDEDEEYEDEENAGLFFDTIGIGKRGYHSVAAAQ